MATSNGHRRPANDRPNHSMKRVALFLAVVLGISSTGCAAVSHRKAKRPTPVQVVTVETTPEGYLFKDKRGTTWLLSISTDGRLVIQKVLPQ